MRALAIAAAVVLVMVLGFVFLAGPAPTIIVAPETVFHWGPLDVTNTMFTSWLVVLFLAGVALYTGPRMQVVPSGFSGVVEAVISGFYSIVEGAVGEERAREFFWVVATIFFYIIVSNYAGLLPLNVTVGKPEVGHGDTQVELQQTSIAGIDVAYVPFRPDTRDATEAEGVSHGGEGASDGGDGEPAYGVIAPYLRSVNTDINAPLAIAIYSAIFVEFWGLRALGFGYLKKFFNFGNLLRGKPVGVIDAFVGVLELVSELSRIVSFTFRLFGNIFAGEVLLTMMAFLVPLVLINVFYGLELFVGAIQAFVFAMLTLVFAQTAVAHHGDDHDEAHTAAHG